MIGNIDYFHGLSFDSLEQITYKMKSEYIEDGQMLFAQGDIMEKIYILVGGSLDIYLVIRDENVVLDEMKIPGSTLG